MFWNNHIDNTNFYCSILRLLTANELNRALSCTCTRSLIIPLKNAEYHLTISCIFCSKIDIKLKALWFYLTIMKLNSPIIRKTFFEKKEQSILSFDRYFVYPRYNTISLTSNMAGVVLSLVVVTPMMNPYRNMTRDPAHHIKSLGIFFQIRQALVANHGACVHLCACLHAFVRACV